MKVMSGVRDKSNRFFTDQNSKNNYAIVLVVFGSIIAKLIVGDRLTAVIATATILTLVLTLYIGSISQTVIIGFVAIISTAVFVSVFKPLSHLLLNPIPFLLLLFFMFIAFVTLFKTSVTLEVPWKSEILSVSLATLSLTLIWNSRLAVNGGAVAALYGSEDNAAWVLSIHRVLKNETFLSGGYFGSLLDSLLLLSYQLGSFLLPALSAIDHLALSVVVLQVMVVFLIPFLPNLTNQSLNAEKSALVSSLVLSLSLLISFRTFNQYGHLSTALSCFLISIYLVIGFKLSGAIENQSRRTFLLYLQISLAYLAGVSWFPVAPLSISLMIFVLYRMFSTSETSRFQKTLISVFAIVLIGLIVYEDLLKRFIYFQTPGQGPVSGAKNLLSFEGGVVSNDPWSVSLVIVFALIVMAVMVFLRINANWYLGELGLLVAYAVSLTLMSTILFNGNVTYGARKVTVLVIFCSAALLCWAIVALVENRLREFITPLLPGVFVLGMILSMPGAGAFAGGKYFAGFDREDHFEQAKQLVRNVEIGRSTVCFSEATEEQAPGLGGSSYTCSRWAAAYSFRDGEEFNEWRRAVLGQVQKQDLFKVKQGLPDDTMVIVIGPDNPDREKNNENWTNLVDKNWTIVR
jgi:hypothetical protein